MRRILDFNASVHSALIDCEHCCDWLSAQSRSPGTGRGCVEDQPQQGHLMLKRWIATRHTFSPEGFLRFSNHAKG
jgi:hypothetical protein